MVAVGVLYLLNERSISGQNSKSAKAVLNNGFSRGILGAQVRLPFLSPTRFLIDTLRRLDLSSWPCW